MTHYRPRAAAAARMMRNRPPHGKASPPRSRIHGSRAIRMVLQGGQPPSTEHGPEPKKMPAFADKLTDTEIARVLTFVRSAWGNDAPPVTTRDVKRMRDAVASGVRH